MTPNPNPSPELLPCPFCGGEAFIRHVEAHDHTPMLKALLPQLELAEDTYWPECGCGAAAEGGNSRSEASAAWNTRALSSQTLPAPGEVEHGTGWVAWNPDTGEEYTPNHPVESGECVEAENIRRSTPQEDALWAAFQGQFMRAEALATVAAANDEEVRKAARAAIGNNTSLHPWHVIDETIAAIRLLPQGGGGK